MMTKRYNRYLSTVVLSGGAYVIWAGTQGSAGAIVPLALPLFLGALAFNAAIVLLSRRNSLRFRTVLAAATVSVLDSWRLNDAQQCVVLGLPRSAAALIPDYRRGAPLPEDIALIVRAGQIHELADVLQDRFGRGSEQHRQWMSAEQDHLHGASPIQLLSEGRINFGQLAALVRQSPLAAA